MKPLWTVEGGPNGRVPSPSLFHRGFIVGAYRAGDGWRFDRFIGENQIFLATALGYGNQLKLIDAISACPDEQSALLMLHTMAAKLNASGFEFL